MAPPTEVFRYCPRCGAARFDTVYGRAKHCRSCDFTYWFNASAAVAALIVDPLGRLMLTRRAVEPFRGMLDLPGGFVDPLETVEHALTRELKEELGADVARAEFFLSFPNEYPFSGLTVYTIDIAFFVELKSLDALTPMDDISEILFFRPADIPLDSIPAVSIRRIVEEAVKKLSR
ncbi:MAG: NUDIX domain-containing protein [Bacteroidales bacterium]|jgi:NADH pyrophosphatase NudC (nudix superfamily)|nr:NUDIX domain-containing protein [Bacteroidales bacterium]